MSIPSERVRLAVALLELEGVGPMTAAEVLAGIAGLPQRADELFKELSALIERRVLTRTFQVSVAILQSALDRADQILERCHALGINIADSSDAAFWKGVWQIPNPPLLLFYRGRPSEAVARAGVAVIGTRHPTEYGAQRAYEFANECVKRGLMVVSGLAQGCDAAAHRGALDGGGCTIALLAHGLHTVHPQQNCELAEQMVNAGGLLVSEYPPGQELRPFQLVRRDRLQAAFSRGLIVIETDIEGGTMHTVRFGIRQRRFVACVAHSLELQSAPMSRGNQMLIDTGIARPLATQEDLTAFLKQLETVNVDPPGIQETFEF